MSIPITPSFVILDRDGVINHDSESYIRSPADWEPIPGAIEAIAYLTQQGTQVCVATNQSGLARGYFDEETLQAIHTKMLTAVEKAGGKILSVAYCPHLPSIGCNCRKPAPGLLYQLRDAWNIPLPQTPFVGDSLRDIQAAQAAGCIPVLVRTGNGAATLAKHAEILKNIPIYADLWDMALNFKPVKIEAELCRHS